MNMLKMLKRGVYSDVKKIRIWVSADKIRNG